MKILPILLLLLAGCGDAKSSGIHHAVYISGPSGVSCYVILDGNDRAVGGNCLR